MVRPLSCKVLAKDLWEHVCVNKRLLSGGMWLFSLGKSMPSPSFIWKGTEIVQRPVWCDLMRMRTLQGASCSEVQLGASTQACHTALFGTAPPIPPASHTPAPAPQHRCPALPAPLAPLGTNVCFPHRRPWPLCLLGLFLAKSLHWQGHLSTAAKLAFYLCSDVTAIAASTESKWQTKCLCIPRFFKRSPLPFAFWHNAIDSTQQARLFNYHNTT